MAEIYLDNSATTKPWDNVVEGMMEYYKHKYGNPSSMHQKGIEAEKAIKSSRTKIAKFLNVDAKEIIFTSGGTEGNNLAIKGVANRYKKRGNHIITSTIEHPSVLNVFKELEKKGFQVSYIKVNTEGKIDLEELESAINEKTILVSIMMVNNEVGVIQNIRSIRDIINGINQQCILHVDGVQAFGKVPCYPRELGIDLFTMSSHKIHGPKGIGAIYKSKDILMDASMHGGGQENAIRSGTENVPAIVGMKIAVENIKLEEDRQYLYQLRAKMKELILKEIPDVVINGARDLEEAAPHILSVSFKDIKGEVLLHSLEQDDIYISTGSACSSKKKGQSHVLKNIGLQDNLIEGTMRISLSILNTEEEMDIFIKVLKERITLLRKIIRR